MVYLREVLAAKDGTFKPISQDWCAMPASSGSCLAENFRVGFINSISTSFCNGSVDAQFHANTGIDGVTLHF